MVGLPSQKMGLHHPQGGLLANRLFQRGHQVKFPYLPDALQDRTVPLSVLLASRRRPNCREYRLIRPMLERLQHYIHGGGPSANDLCLRRLGKEPKHNAGLEFSHLIIV